MLDAEGVAADCHTLCTWVGLAEVDSSDLQVVGVVDILGFVRSDMVFVLLDVLMDLEVRRLFAIFAAPLSIGSHLVAIDEDHDDVDDYELVEHDAETDSQIGYLATG